MNVPQDIVIGIKELAIMIGAIGVIITAFWKVLKPSWRKFLLHSLGAKVAKWDMASDKSDANEDRIIALNTTVSVLTKEVNDMPQLSKAIQTMTEAMKEVSQNMRDMHESNAEIREDVAFIKGWMNRRDPAHENTWKGIDRRGGKSG